MSALPPASRIRISDGDRRTMTDLYAFNEVTGIPTEAFVKEVKAVIDNITAISAHNPQAVLTSGLFKLVVAELEQAKLVHLQHCWRVREAILMLEEQIQNFEIGQKDAVKKEDLRPLSNSVGSLTNFIERAKIPKNPKNILYACDCRPTSGGSTKHSKKDKIRVRLHYDDPVLGVQSYIWRETMTPDAATDRIATLETNFEVHASIGRWATRWKEVRYLERYCFIMWLAVVS